MKCSRFRVHFCAILLMSGCVIYSFSNTPIKDEEKISRLRSEYIDEIKNYKQKGRYNYRDIYISKLSNLCFGKEDPEVFDLLFSLIQNDKNDWIKLEAIAVITNLQIPQIKRNKLRKILRKHQKDKRINFQVFASKSLIEISDNKTDIISETILSKIATGIDLEKWDIMIPESNKGKMIRDSDLKSEVPFKSFFKKEYRLKAIDGISKSKSDFSINVLKSLGKSKSESIRKMAKTKLSQKSM